MACKPSSERLETPSFWQSALKHCTVRSARLSRGDGSTDSTRILFWRSADRRVLSHDSRRYREGLVFRPGATRRHQPASGTVFYRGSLLLRGLLQGSVRRDRE